MLEAETVDGRNFDGAAKIEQMTANDFRRIALSLEGAKEGSHMGAADFRAGGRIFATRAAIQQGYGNVKLTSEMQAEFVAELPKWHRETNEIIDD